MSDSRDNIDDLPALSRLRTAMRDDLVRAAHADLEGSRLSRRRRRSLGALFGVVLVTVPAGLAGAGAFESDGGRVVFECAEAAGAPLGTVATGPPVAGPGSPDERPVIEAIGEDELRPGVTLDEEPPTESPETITLKQLGDCD